MTIQSPKKKNSNILIIGILIGLCLLVFIVSAVINAFKPTAPQPTVDVNAINTSAVLTVIAPYTQTAAAAQLSNSQATAASALLTQVAGLDADTRSHRHPRAVPLIHCMPQRKTATF